MTNKPKRRINPKNGMIVHSAKVVRLMDKKEKKDQIMQAALELFAQRGYHGTPVSLIAEQANVGSGTIYRYFRDKDDLVNTLYRHWKQKFFEETAEQIDLNQPLRSLFRDICFKLVQFAEKYRSAFVFMEAHHHSPYLDEESIAVSERLKEQFFAVLREGQAQEVIASGSPEMLYSAVFGIFSETLKMYWNKGQSISTEIISKIEEMAWQAIRR